MTKTHKFPLQPGNIIVLGWSIGGFTATWLALTYPEIRGLVVDATFDELEPLAVPRMPAFMSGVVRQECCCFDVLQKFRNID